jgi:hypothetical protein
VIIQAGSTLLRKEYFPFFEVQKVTKNKANRHFLAGIALHASLDALLREKTIGCESRPFGLA